MWKKIEDNIINHKMIIILCTLPNNNVPITLKLVKILLDNKLAACVSILNKIHSFYYWENKLQNQTEIQLLIKTKYSLKKAAFNAIKTIHPYSVPELIALPILDGDPKYLSWMQSVLK